MNNSLLKIKGNKLWDVIRKKWIKITPEEIIRQQFIHFLIANHFPSTHIAVEKEFFFNCIKKRFDILVYDKQINPFVLIECKREKTKIDYKVTDQITPYMLSLNATYFIITNGITMHIFKRHQHICQPINTFPIWQ